MSILSVFVLVRWDIVTYDTGIYIIYSYMYNGAQG